ncbi:MAG: hypothetical protein ACXVRZ_00265 [Gaiellaceae bacterium]
MATTGETQTLEAFDQLTTEEKKNVASQIVVRALGDPSLATTNNLWYIIVGTFSALVIGGLIVLLVLVLDGKGAGAVTPLITLGAGVLGGLLAPSPGK